MNSWQEVSFPHAYLHKKTWENLQIWLHQMFKGGNLKETFILEIPISDKLCFLKKLNFRKWIFFNSFPSYSYLHIRISIFKCWNSQISREKGIRQITSYLCSCKVKIHHIKWLHTKVEYNSCYRLFSHHFKKFWFPLLALNVHFSWRCLA